MSVAGSARRATGREGWPPDLQFAGAWLYLDDQAAAEQLIEELLEAGEASTTFSTPAQGGLADELAEESLLSVQCTRSALRTMPLRHRRIEHVRHGS